MLWLLFLSIICETLLSQTGCVEFEIERGKMTEVLMCIASVSELSPDEERILIRDIALASQANSKEGDTFFLITQRFFLRLFPSFSQLGTPNLTQSSHLFCYFIRLGQSFTVWENGHALSLLRSFVFFALNFTNLTRFLLYFVFNWDGMSEF